MQVNASSRGGVQVLSLAGRLDANAAADLEQRLREVGDKLVVDLSGVTFLGSLAIRAFMGAAKRTKESGGRLVFCGLTPDVQKVLDVTGLSLRLDITPDINAALTKAEQPVAAATTPPGTAVPGDTREIESPFAAVKASPAARQGANAEFPFLDAPNAPGEMGWMSSYRVMRLLGTGGMGMVFEAEDVHLRRRVALKVMKPEIATDRNARERFLQEARTAASVPHDNIVTIFQVSQHNDIPFLAMQYLEGESLEARLEREGPLPLGDVLRIGREVAEGLSAAHAHGLIHRDIKPANIWLEGDGPGKPFRRVRILDFGLARPAASNRNLTGTGLIVGTPGFLAPEQAKGQTLDHRCDLFSLGCVLYCMISGSEPFAGTDVLAVLSALAMEDPRSLAELDPKAPRDLTDLVHMMLAKKPEDRPASAREVADCLLAIANEHGLSICPLATGEQKAPSTIRPALEKQLAARGQDRRRSLAVLGAVGLAIVLAAGFFWFNRNPGGPTGPTGPPIKVGILHSLSGTLQISGQAVHDATLLAIEEINDKGGVLGRPILPVSHDNKSDEDEAKRGAEYLIRDQNVSSIFGCWTSANRKAVLPVVEKYNNLLLYPVQYEGLENSPNIIYLGAAPNQQILPAVQHGITAMGKRRLFLVGSDYIFPRAANAIIRDAVAKEPDAQIVGEEYIPLGSSHVHDMIEKIKKEKPDLILNTINGSSNNSFFDELRNAKIMSDQTPTISFSIAENELRGMDMDDVVGDYAAWNYFQSIDTPENKAFVKRFKDRFGQHRVVSDPMEAAYVSVHMWAQAVEAAKSTEPLAIREALKGREFNAPHGTAKIDPVNLHTWKPVRIGRIQRNGQFEIISNRPTPIRPEPYPATRTPGEWKQFLEKWHQEWNQRWEAPRR